MKEVYQSLTVDVIGKCAFGIEVNSLQKDRLDTTNKFYSSAVDTFSSFVISNRWMSLFWLFFFNMFPELLPVSSLFPTKQMDCKYLPFLYGSLDM